MKRPPINTSESLRDQEEGPVKRARDKSSPDRVSDDKAIVASDDEGPAMPTIDTIRNNWKANWSEVKKIVVKMESEVGSIGMRAVMRFFEQLSEELSFVDMRLSIDSAGLTHESTKSLKKKLRKLCRTLNLEENINPSDGTTRFRAPEELRRDVCDPFDLVEVIFEDAMGVPMEVYFQSKKIVKAKHQASDSTFEIPDDVVMKGLDAQGRPMYRKKTLIELHREGLVKEEDVEKGRSLIDKQRSLKEQWGMAVDDVGESSSRGGHKGQHEFEDGQEEYNRTRFDRSIIEKGTGTVQSKASAEEFVAKLASGGRFSEGQITKSFL